VTLEYPMSATAKGDDVIPSSWFTGTVQLIDRKTGFSKCRKIHALRKRTYACVGIGLGPPFLRPCPPGKTRLPRLPFH
jgi:hypothetical protein